jgi:hypothetical protein
MKNNKSSLFKKAILAIGLSFTLVGCSLSPQHNKIIDSNESYAKSWASQESELSKHMVEVPFIYNNDLVIKSWQEMAMLSKESLRNHGFHTSHHLVERFLVIASQSASMEYSDSDLDINLSSEKSAFRAVLAKDLHSMHLINSEVDNVPVYIFASNKDDSKVAVMINAKTKKVIGITKYEF